MRRYERGRSPKPYRTVILFPASKSITPSEIFHFCRCTHLQAPEPTSLAKVYGRIVLHPEGFRRRLPRSVANHINIQSASDLCCKYPITESVHPLAGDEKVSALKPGLDDPNFPRIADRRGTSGFPMSVLRGTGIRVRTIVISKCKWNEAPAEIDAQLELCRRGLILLRLDAEASLSEPGDLRMVIFL